MTMTSMVDVQECLAGALEEKLQTVIVVGFDQDGRLFVSASTGDAREVVYLLSNATPRVLDGDYAIEGA